MLDQKPSYWLNRPLLSFHLLTWYSDCKYLFIYFSVFNTYTYTYFFFLTLRVICIWLTVLFLWLVKDVPVVAVVTEEVKEQLVEASAVTKKAFTTYRREAEAEEHQAAADGTPVPTADKSQEEGEMSVIITIMQPILRLMQLLCENHNRDLQVSQQ